jgi:hypothetical protein
MELFSRCLSPEIIPIRQSYIKSSSVLLVMHCKTDWFNYTLLWSLKKLGLAFLITHRFSRLSSSVQIVLTHPAASLPLRIRPCLDLFLQISHLISCHSRNFDTLLQTSTFERHMGILHCLCPPWRERFIISDARYVMTNCLWRNTVCFLHVRIAS